MLVDLIEVLILILMALSVNQLSMQVSGESYFNPGSVGESSGSNPVYESANSQSSVEPDRARDTFASLLQYGNSSFDDRVEDGISYFNPNCLGPVSGKECNSYFTNPFKKSPVAGVKPTMNFSKPHVPGVKPPAVKNPFRK